MLEVGNQKEPKWRLLSDYSGTCYLKLYHRLPPVQRFRGSEVDNKNDHAESSWEPFIKTADGSFVSHVPHKMEVWSSLPS